MEPLWEGTLVGIFEGYQPGRVYSLSDGSRWRQEGGPTEHVHRENPHARLLRDRNDGRVYLDVEGTSNVAHVVPADARPTIRAGAF